MADAFKSDYFNMPVHVSRYGPNINILLYVSLSILNSITSHFFVTDGAHRAGRERVLAFGWSH